MGCTNLLWGVTHRAMGSKNGHFGRYVIIEWSLGQNLQDMVNYFIKSYLLL